MKFLDVAGETLYDTAVDKLPEWVEIDLAELLDSVQTCWRAVDREKYVDKHGKRRWSYYKALIERVHSKLPP